MTKKIFPRIMLVGKAAVFMVGLAVVLFLTLAVVAESAEAAGRYKTVTKTFSNPSAITIDDSTGLATPYPSTVAAGGMRRGKILDANITLRGYTHGFSDDVDVRLVGPGGQNATIMSDVGGGSDVSNITLTLDDEAVDSLPDGGPLVSGTFKPTNLEGVVDDFPAPAPTPSGAVALSTFDGTNPNGTWSLYVFDDASSDAGNFAGGWSITIRAKVLR